MMWRAALTGVVMALLLIGGLTLFQNRLLYFPERVPLADLLADAGTSDLRAWPAEGDFRGLVREPHGPAKATLVLFHGNAGHAGHRAHYAALARWGIRVILAEYPGYGPRAGSVGEEALVADAAQTVEQAHRAFGAPVLLAGESLGAGVAAAACARVPASVAALWLITPWDTLAHVARHHYPWLPVAWMLRDRYDSLSHLADAPIPVAIVVAGRDAVVPPRFGNALYAHLNGPKRLWQLPQAGHNDWLLHVDDRWWAEVLNYLLHANRATADAVLGNG